MEGSAQARNAVGSAFTPAVLDALTHHRLQTMPVEFGRSAGVRLSKQRGRSLEFTDLRAYTPGDDLRDIDWNAFARLESLMIRTYAAEVALPLHIVVDASQSMRWGEEPQKLAQALRIVAALALIADASDVPFYFHNLKSCILQRQPARQLIGQLDRIAIGEEGEIEPILGCLEAMLRSGDRCSVVLIGDGYESELLLPILRRLRAAGNELCVIQTLHENEMQPNFAGDIEMTDAESGETIQVNLDERALEEYRRRLNAFLSAWKAGCRRINAKHALAIQGPNFSELPLQALRNSGLIRRVR